MTKRALGWQGNCFHLDRLGSRRRIKGDKTREKSLVELMSLRQDVGLEVSHEAHEVSVLDALGQMRLGLILKRPVEARRVVRASRQMGLQCRIASRHRPWEEGLLGDLREALRRRDLPNRRHAFTLALLAWGRIAVGTKETVRRVPGWSQA